MNLDEEVVAAERLEETSVEILRYWLLANVDLEKHTNWNVVAFLAGASLQSLEVLQALRRTRFVIWLINWRWSMEDITAAFIDVCPKCIVTDATWLATANSLQDRICHRLHAAKHVPILLVNHKNSFCPKNIDLMATTRQILEDSGKNYDFCGESCVDLRKCPEDPKYLIFTSGTTSKPKGAILSSENMEFQIKAKHSQCGYQSSDVYLHTAPWFHVGGLCSALAMIDAGARHVFMPSFDAKASIEIIQAIRVTAFIAVPTMLVDILEAAKKENISPQAFNSVTTILLGAGGIQEPYISQAMKCFSCADIFNSYGMTEACSSLTYYKLGTQPFPDRTLPGMAYVGKAHAGVQLAVMDEKNTSVVSENGMGEIITRGPHVFLRYWGAADVPTDRVLDSNFQAWFRTGDLGCINEEGHVWLLGRAKDMIKTGGENVAAAEVERCLSQHPGILAVAVVGVPDVRWGEKVVAGVVTSAEFREKFEHEKSLLQRGDRMFDHIRQHCLTLGLASFKFPKLMAMFNALPQNTTGKIDKKNVQKNILSLISLSKAANL